MVFFSQSLLLALQLFFLPSLVLPHDSHVVLETILLLCQVLDRILLLLDFFLCFLKLLVFVPETI